MRFVGRSQQLGELEGWYSQVATSSSGLMLTVRGRRQVGKSTLYTEFLRRGRLAHVYFTAIKDGSNAVQMDAFRRDAIQSRPAIPNADVLFGRLKVSPRVLSSESESPTSESAVG